MSMSKMTRREDAIRTGIEAVIKNAINRGRFGESTRQFRDMSLGRERIHRGIRDLFGNVPFGKLDRKINSLQRLCEIYGYDLSRKKNKLTGQRQSIVDKANEVYLASVRRPAFNEGEIRITFPFQTVVLEGSVNG